MNASIREIKETVLESAGVSSLSWRMAVYTDGSTHLEALVFFTEPVSQAWGEEIANSDALSVQESLMDYGFDGALYDQDHDGLDMLVFTWGTPLEFSYINGLESWTALANMEFPDALSHDDFVEVFDYSPIEEYDNHNYSPDEVLYTMQYYPATAGVTASINNSIQIFGSFDANTGEIQ